MTEAYFEDWSENRSWEVSFICVVIEFTTRGATIIKKHIM